MGGQARGIRLQAEARGRQGTDQPRSLSQKTTALVDDLSGLRRFCVRDAGKGGTPTPFPGHLTTQGV